ncbi:response regulator transcription factor [Alkalimarinus sediminis]|uniref:Response regulator transcription factor n=1 Tax=Alkalimarinus sediminis TaxID=1632866 RepID=A0A9E8KRN6_9ALTE|nr:response regulator transcription factor [Alkalimarinus sediminis]UZW76297.1 response regulator transcription factor [Alkalimarinus sediminis]
MRLLLVEDDVDLVISLRKDLERAGYAVDNADNGVEAEYLGKESIYDAIILDLGLPKRSGLEVLGHWREEGYSMPVIILTARGNWHERVDGFKAGADDYLGKPFHIEELLARLNAVLQRSHNNAPSEQLEKSGLVLDSAKQTITTEDSVTHALTGIEFRLVRYFMLHPGKILSKAMLTEHVYDFDSDKDSNVIEVYVKRLRQIIGKTRIETRRGQGYLFKDTQ